VAAAPWSPNSSIASTALFGEARLGLLEERLTATLGGRLDRVAFDVLETDLLATHTANSETHLVFNPSAGFRYTTDAGISLRGSAGRAFVTPDAFNVAGYSATSAGAGVVNVTRGNPELRPESSITWDAGVGLLRRDRGLDVELTYFQTDVRDRITASSAPGAGTRTPAGDSINTLTTYINVDEAEIRGVEATLGYDFGALTGWNRSLRVFTNASRILRAEQITGGVRAPILNVARTNVNAGVELDDLRRFAGRVAARYVGERQDQDFNDWMNPGNVVFPPFLVMDLSADVRVGDRYTIGARVENLTDENYYEVRGYPLPGRSLRLQAGVAF
jgi:vitamin B12 transporter